MKKYVVLTLLCIIFGIITNAQTLPNGVYSDNSKYGYFICIKNDTVLYHSSSTSWYMGTYQFMNKKYYFNDNLLLGKNAYIEKESCSTDSIEIKFICKYQHILLGAPMVDSTIYEGESDFYYTYHNEWKFESRDQEGIHISKGTLSQEDLSNGFLLVEGGWLSGFQDYFNIPLEYGTRYTLKHKYYRFNPIIILEKINGKRDYILYDKNNNKLLVTHEITKDNSYTNTYPYYSPNCDSCFNAFKNRFPDLFK